ncbi:hypothetical protein GW17_00017923 [Ensete ventricosum]|nr:hypothetical protein GW17_00017923 [Ensete ventricosum]RZS27270.1 hypothetical protein BHM03_00060714 [Ensete ventricosum]
MAELNSSIILLLVVLISTHLLSSANSVYNIAEYGAKSDGRTDSTKSLLGAWQAACGSPGPSTVHVPAGSFLVRQVTFNGPCKSSKIVIRIDGTLVLASDLGRVGGWIVFDHVEGVSVYGGTIDGRGASLWACKATGRRCPGGATVSLQPQNVTLI